MTTPITRRRFLIGASTLLGHTAISGCKPNPAPLEDPIYRPIAASEIAQKIPYYPPALLGLRGDHDGSQQHPHATAWHHKTFTFSDEPAEQFDLIVVGAGVSGLTAAYRFQQKQPEAKILILDNHDDFGGHAKRNEFTVNDQLLITYGGSESLDNPQHTYSQNAHQLLTELGVDYVKLGQCFAQDLYTQQWQLHSGIFFNQAAFGSDKIVKDMPTIGQANIASIINEFPMPDADKQALIEIYTTPKDYLAGKTKAQKNQYIDQTSYYDFLKNDVKLPEHALAFLTNLSLEYWGHPINGISVREALDGTFGTNTEDRYPAVQNLGLTAESEEHEPYIYHFPDGNASIARLLVRKLIPNAASGNSMEDIVTTKFDYEQLDKPENQTRIRLNHTALRIENQENHVSVGYLKTGATQLRLAQAKKVIFAGHAALAPHIIPEMKDAQTAAMKSNVKVPIIYAKVALHNAHAWQKLGVHALYLPASPYCLIQLDYPVNIGQYAAPKSPDEPIVLHCVRIATTFTGKDAREKYRNGRRAVLHQTATQLETELREILRSIYALAGEEADKAIAAITLNRWAHGYSYEQAALWDDDETAETTTQRMKQKIGNIFMANSDVTWMPYLQYAIDEGSRAAQEALA